MSAERQLRLVQVACILLVAICIFVRHLGGHKTHDGITLSQWLVIVAAIWSAFRVHGAAQGRCQNSISTALEKIAAV